MDLVPEVAGGWAADALVKTFQRQRHTQLRQHLNLRLKNGCACQKARIVQTASLSQRTDTASLASGEGSPEKSRRVTSPVESRSTKAGRSRAWCRQPGAPSSCRRVCLSGLACAHAGATAGYVKVRCKVHVTCVHRLLLVDILNEVCCDLTTRVCARRAVSTKVSASCAPCTSSVSQAATRHRTPLQDTLVLA